MRAPCCSTRYGTGTCSHSPLRMRSIRWQACAVLASCGSWRGGKSASRIRQTRLTIRIGSTIATRHGEYSIQVKMRDDSLIRIAWADVSMNDFQIRVFPSSVLPQQPSNRLQKLQTLFDAGIIDRQTFLQQLGAPDLN